MAVDSLAKQVATHIAGGSTAIANAGKDVDEALKNGDDKPVCNRCSDGIGDGIFEVRCEYRKATGKGVGKVFEIVDKILTVLVLIEVVFLVLMFGISWWVSSR